MAANRMLPALVAAAIVAGSGVPTARAGDGLTDVTALLPTLDVAARSQVVMLSQTDETANTSPELSMIAADPPFASDMIAETVRENDLFTVSKGGHVALEAQSRIILVELSRAKAPAYTEMAGAAAEWTVDNTIRGADVTGPGAMMASIPARALPATAAGLATLTALLTDSPLPAAEPPSEESQTPENAAWEYTPLTIATTHGFAINAAEVE